MDNFRPWAMWRRIWYGTGFASFWVLAGVLVFFLNFYQAPNCFDGILNGTEIEEDAGGTCVRVPDSLVRQPNIVWAEGFETTPGQYNAVAYVENRNQTIGTPALPYTFSFLNNGVEIARRSGVTELPPNSVYPLFEGRVFTDGQTVTDVELTLGKVQDWLPASSNSNKLRTSDLNLLNVDTRPRLEAKLENTSLDTIREVEVVATIFNDVGKAVAASQTFIETFPPRTSQDIIFTWPNTIAKTVRSCSIPTSVLMGIDLSGSMNNDQDVPPQPVTDALAAASAFVGGLQPVDRVGVVTFASQGTLVQTLTDAHGTVIDLISDLGIDPGEEAGQTNTAAAFTLATTELSSVRHSADARRAFVLLTDGLPTAGGTQEATAAAQTAAQALIDSGADVYVIGLGQNVDSDFIRSIASGPSQAYLAPSRNDLSAIYASITDSLCEVGPTKIEVLAKPSVTFAPLR
ncbi:MAG: Mg-chelatase subunit ChlD [Candidatus Paceibacteria bacterium]|jgi:Mg-chelatase subunit ChlD